MPIISSSSHLLYLTSRTALYQQPHHHQQHQLSSIIIISIIMELPIDLVRIIIMYAPTKTLPTFSGLNKQIAKLAVRELLQRMCSVRKNKNPVAIRFTKWRIVKRMGVTRVCKLLAIQQRLFRLIDEHYQVDSTTMHGLMLRRPCIMCQEEDTIGLTEAYKGRFRTSVFECTKGARPCTASYRMLFKPCTHPAGCPYDNKILHCASTQGR